MIDCLKKMGMILCLAGLLFAHPVQALAAFEDIRYDIKATFFPQEKALRARQVIRFTNASGVELQEIYLRVYPHHRYSAKEKRALYQYATFFKVNPFPEGFDAGEFRFESLTCDGKDLDAQWQGEDETVLRIALPSALKDQQELVLELSYYIRVPHRYGRFGWHQRTFALNRWYPLLSVFDGKEWNNPPDYLFHMPYVSEAALYSFELGVPMEYTVVTGCDRVQDKDSGDGYKVILGSSSAPMRELPLAISADYSRVEKTAGDVRIQSYYLPGDADAARQAAEFAAGMMAYSVSKAGNYPYEVLSIAPVYLGYGGSQNAGLIFIDERMHHLPPFLKRQLDFLVAHETGHQWWYNAVGNDEYKELWLDEGLNSFWTTSYLENKYGPQAKLLEMPRWVEWGIPNPTFEDLRLFRYLSMVRKGLDRPVVSDMASFYEPSLIFSLAYGKGSFVVKMLEARMGPEAFTAAVKKYYETFCHRVATIEDFRLICEEITGQDYREFFDTWLKGKGRCDYALVRQKDGFGLLQRGRVQTSVDIRFDYTDGTTEVVTASGEDRERVFPESDKEVKSATLDPDEILPDVDRVNNVWPRQIESRLVPFYHGLYDLSLFQKEDAYNWISGPVANEYGYGARTGFYKPGEYVIYAAEQYDFDAEAFHSVAGFEKQNLFSRYLSLGFEFLDRNTVGDTEDDLHSYKLYLRQELSLPYSLLDYSSHVSLYLLRERRLGDSGYLSSREYAQGMRYRKNDETIVGVTYYRSTAGALPDPAVGYKLTGTQEFGGHMLGGGDSFVRTSLEHARYFEIGGFGKIACRLKGCFGYPDDKYLFYLGSPQELRGYDYKSVQGSSAFLGSVEYRFPIVSDLRQSVGWNVVRLDQIQAVAFFDAGSAWYDEFDEPGVYKDVGAGLRFYLNIAGSAERLCLRLDVAYPLDGQDKETKVWFGINQAF